MTHGYSTPILQKAEELGTNAAVLSGGASAIGGLGTTLYNSDSLFSIFGIINAANSAYSATENLTGYIKPITQSITNGTQKTQQSQTDNLSNIKKIYNGCFKIIESSLSQGFNPIDEVSQAVTQLLTNKIIGPEVVKIALKQLQKDTVRNPELSNGLGEIAEKISGQV
jgi:hypothetical protein